MPARRAAVARRVERRASTSRRCPSRWPSPPNGEGPAATGAAAWHAAGVDGTGVKVAIVDLGFTGLAASQARGDIPNTAIEHNECAAGLNGNTDHGTAVAEIVHEMAPGAQLYLVCIDCTAALNAAKDFLVAQDVSIANFSVAFFNSARGDGSGGAGTPDAIVADAASEGILWVNSAGNAAQTHYQGTFADGRTPTSSTSSRRGDQADERADRRRPDRLRLPALGRVAGRDNRLRPLPHQRRRHRHGRVEHERRRPGTQRAGRAVCFNNTGATAAFHLFIQRVAGTGTPRMDLFTNNGVFDTEYAVASSSILDPGASTVGVHGRRDLLPERQPRAVLLAGPDDRRPPQARHRRPGRGHLRRLRGVLDLRELRLHRHLRRVAAHRGRGRAGQAGEPEPHRGAAAQLPPRPCRRARRRRRGQPVRGGQAAARRARALRPPSRPARRAA